MKKKSIYWFTSDLRLDDNKALAEAVTGAGEMAFVYVIDQRWFKKNRYQSTAIGNQRLRFLRQSLVDLDKQLADHEQSLQLFYGKPELVIATLIEEFSVTHVFRSILADYNLNRCWQKLVAGHPHVEFSQYSTHTLFDRHELPFELKCLPATFTEFKKTVGMQNVKLPISKPAMLVKKLSLPCMENDPFTKIKPGSTCSYEGGSTPALKQLNDYFTKASPDRYFELRNSLAGRDNSTKFSPWLANGCLSARQVAASLSDYEAKVIRNKSTCWIYFELLWREYFQWYAHKHGPRLFRFAGIKQHAPLTSFYPERFRKWCGGNTPYPIVNACMNELNATGCLSNRGRQIVASCFVNELGIDWRFGAAYFEQQLIDYDVANNWGNWQYLAGVGADPQQKRHFNLDRQTRQFDPAGDYIQAWTADIKPGPLDSVDAADWPIS